jgi:radical SAM superfamily enzyme YgiQ (UPF0313 family)
LRVLLVSPNRERVPDPVYPLGLSYISTTLKNAGHDVSALDLCFSDDIESAIRESVEEFEPGVVGISIRNIDDVVYPKSTCYIDSYQEILRYIRKYSDARVVLGGAGLTIMPEAFMGELKADYAIVGEGEVSFCDLLKKIENGISIEENIIRSEKEGSSNWSHIIPDRTLFDTDTYYAYGGMLNVQTKRGCPFQCIYCSYPLIEGRKCRMRDPGNVADELEMIVKTTGIRHFFIVDSIFNHPVDFAEQICDAIIERGLDISWTCYGTPLGMTDRLAEKMKKAGCTSIEFGVDSLIDGSLSTMKKGFTYRQVVNAAKICRVHDIKYCIFIFVGAPGDTMDTVKLNFERIEDLSPDASMIMTGLRIFPNTKLADIAGEELGMDRSSISLRPVYFISPSIIKEMDSIVEYIKDNHPKWILPGFEININEKILALLRKSGIKGSLWEEFIKR